MVGELIFVGTEGISGNTGNENAVLFAEKCAELGIYCYYQTAAMKEELQLEEQMKQAWKRADVILISGQLTVDELEMMKSVTSRVMGETTEVYTVDLVNKSGNKFGWISQKDDKTMVMLPGSGMEQQLMFLEHVYPYLQSNQPEEAVVELLLKHEMTVTTVESCTGGLLSGSLVNVAGVSEVFKKGFVTYSNKAKRKLVNVNKQTLKEYGAVSEKTAKEMARGGLLAAGSDASVAVTGIAGPGGGSEEKPVGLVYIAVAIDDKVWVKKYQFNGSRRQVREQSVAAALKLLRLCILEYVK